ncbi:hypothetical protein ACFVT9_13205 [Kitasatospora cineracea]|uniref:hypothetical protein n=1 Tax=Kitasatospora TaxID=2063 RepID=UPI0004C471A7|nr:MULTISPECIES: hypothetical protein [unclassified Kitasatospora]WAL71889.1 hypothetical protein OU787_10500 [Kitasatospora sp. YST-16]WNW37933.1 hypothetical protein RKE32_10460 [Streptomyces sp. Li-HN-5-13]
MGIFDRFRHKAAAQPPADSPERAALAHDEAADAFGDRVERARDDAERRIRQEREDREAAENMTAEGDPWS